MENSNHRINHDSEQDLVEQFPFVIMSKIQEYYLRIRSKVSSFIGELAIGSGVETIERNDHSDSEPW